jgi:PKD repeat protein
MKRVFAIVLGLLALSTLVCAFSTVSTVFDLTMAASLAHTDVGGPITTNTTWALADSPYVVVADVVVLSDVFLTIEPGVVVKFANGTTLVVDGTLLAEGNATHGIVFTSNATIPASGDWGGIDIRTGGSYKNVNWVTVEYSADGIKGLSHSNVTYCAFLGNNAGLSGANMHVAKSGFKTNGKGLLISTGEVAESTFCSNGIGLSGSDINLTFSTFEGNGRGATVSDSFVSSCRFINNTEGVAIAKGKIVDSETAQNKGFGIGGTDMIVENTNVSCNGEGIVNDWNIFAQTCEIRKCLISQNSGNGVIGANKMYDSHVCENGGKGVIFNGAEVTMSHSKVSENLDGGVIVLPLESSALLEYSEISGNLFGIQISSMRGYSGPVSVSSCMVLNNMAGGIVTDESMRMYDFYGANLFVSDSVIVNNGRFGIRLNTTLKEIGEDVCSWIHELSGTVISNHIVGAIGEFGIINGSVVSNCTIGAIGDFDSVSDSIFANNSIGASGSFNVVLRSKIVNNSVGASGSFSTVSNSTIKSNSEIGLNVTNVLNSICFNNIYDNGIYNIKNHIPYGWDVNATNNWWGTTNETLIKERIYDYYDNYTFSKVLYKPYLTEPIIIGTPVASFVYSPPEPVANETVTFNASASYDPNGDIVAYAWDFGDTTNSTETDPITTHAYANAGNCTVTLTVTDDEGLTDTIAKPILVHSRYATKISISLSPNPVIIQQSVTLLGNLTTTNNLPINGATIIIKSDNFQIATLTTNSTGWFTATAPAKPAGTFNITAEYAGSTQYLPSSDWEILTVQKAETAIYATFVPNPVKTNSSCELRGILTDQFGNPIKLANVSLYYSTDYGSSWHFAGTLTTNRYGTFSTTFTTPSPGTYIVRTSYEGSPIHKPSTADTPLIVR